MSTISHGGPAKLSDVYAIVRINPWVLYLTGLNSPAIDCLPANPEQGQKRLASGRSCRNFRHGDVTEMLQESLKRSKLAKKPFGFVFQLCLDWELGVREREF